MSLHIKLRGTFIVEVLIVLKFSFISGFGIVGKFDSAIGLFIRMTGFPEIHLDVLKSKGSNFESLYVVFSGSVVVTVAVTATPLPDSMSESGLFGVFNSGSSVTWSLSGKIRDLQSSRIKISLEFNFLVVIDKYLSIVFSPW